MLDTICREIKNYFVADSDKYIGDFSIVDGVVSPSLNIQTGQYYRIVGSVSNESVYKRGEEKLIDETTFHGAIWLMRPPKDFLQLVTEIEAWENKYGGANGVINSPYQSESFGNYARSMKTASATNGTSGVTWQSTFASELNKYRKVIL